MDAAFSSGGPSFSEHDDVMSASPSDEHGKKALVDEIKNRARAVFSSKNYPVAEALYSKALEVLPDATLYANRSAVRVGMNKLESALVDADMSIALDPTYAKGYYRRGQACVALGGIENLQCALSAFEHGASMEPSNNAWSVQIKKVRTALDTGKALKNDSPVPTPVTSSSTRKTVAPKVTEGGGGVSSPSMAVSGTADEEEEEKVPKAGGTPSQSIFQLRGYKKTVDGRTTTYFHSELSEEAKALIGDIAPKKIDSNGGAVGMPVDEAGGKSAWNTAGTWEEKDSSAWCRERLLTLLSDLNVDTPKGTITITGAPEIEGDASITFSRGKRRYMYEYSVKINWEASVVMQENNDISPEFMSVKGSIHMPDVGYDCEGNYEVNVSATGKLTPEGKTFYETYVKSSKEGLQPAVMQKLAQFVEEFQKK